MKNRLKEINFNALRIELLDYVHRRGGHSTSSLSCLEILGSILQVGGVNHPVKSSLDLIISKGHAEIGVYIMLKEFGFIDADFLDKEYRTNNFALPGHISNTIPGIIYSAGSLGHGLGFGAGYAYGKYLRNNPTKTIILISDGECCEGSTFEALNFVGTKNLLNVLIILDHNKIASCSFTEEITNIGAIESYCKSNNISVDHINGHSYENLCDYINNWHKSETKSPKILIADTVKGKGFKHLQNSPLWHVLPINDEAYEKALESKEF